MSVYRTNGPLALFGVGVLSRPPIQLLHSINQNCNMKKRDLCAMHEMDFKFYIIIFSCQ